MSALDIIMLCVLGGGAALGFLRGFVQEALSLAAWALAVIAVRMFLAPVGDLIGAKLGVTSGGYVLSFLLLFGLALTAGRLLARRIGRSSRGSVLGSVDRVLGAGFGAIKGLLGATLLFLAFTLVYNMMFGVGAERPEWMRAARSYTLLDASGRAITRFARYSSGADAAASEMLSPDEPGR